MNNMGSYTYDSDENQNYIEGDASDEMFSLGRPRKWNMYREADCELRKKQVKVKDIDCNLGKREKTIDSNRMIKTKNNQYVSCTLVKDRKRERTLEDKLNNKESSIRADYEWENKINQNIELQMASEEKSLIYNAFIAIACSVLYMLFFIVTEGDYSTSISVVLTIALIAAVLNLAGTVILYMIDNDFKLTRGLGEMLGIEPLFLQKTYSDRKLLMLEAELSKIKIVKKIDINQ